MNAPPMSCKATCLRCAFTSVSCPTTTMEAKISIRESRAKACQGYRTRSYSRYGDNENTNNIPAQRHVFQQQTSSEERCFPHKYPPG